jgi:hypothetical protein
VAVKYLHGAILLFDFIFRDFWGIDFIALVAVLLKADGNFKFKGTSV